MTSVDASQQMACVLRECREIPIFILYLSIRPAPDAHVDLYRRLFSYRKLIMFEYSSEIKVFYFKILQ